MFVKRKPSRVPPGRRNKQIYVPHKQMQIVTPPLEIRTKADALFYYNELDRLGYIPHPIDDHTNAIVATLASSDNTFVEFAADNNNIIFSGDPLEADAIEPAPMPEQEYDVQLLNAVVIDLVTLDGNAAPYWVGYFEYTNAMTYQRVENNSQSVLLYNIDSIMYQYLKVGQDYKKCILLNHDHQFHIFRCDQWKISLSPVQTLLNILMIPVNQ